MQSWMLIFFKIFFEYLHFFQVGVDEKLAKLMEKQAQSVVTTKTRSKEEENLKSAILAQYAQVRRWTSCYRIQHCCGDDS